MRLLFTRLTVFALGVLLLAGCDNKRAGSSGSAEAEAKFRNFQEAGDLQQMQQRGVLRLLAPRWEDEGLPRAGLPTQGYRQLADDFAARMGLEPQWILVDTHSEMIERLENGYGDLIVAHLTQTESRLQRINFSVPVSSAYEQMIGPRGRVYESAEQLQGLKIAVGRGSSFAESLHHYRVRHPELQFTLIETDTGDPEWLLDQMQEGAFDATVMDHNTAESLATYRDDFSMGMAITPTRPIAWAMRHNSLELRQQLNNFFTEARISATRRDRYLDDLDGIKARKTLRMITRNSPATYFLWRGELMGYEYELMKIFANRHNLRLEVEVAPADADLFDMLKNGEGDVIAAAVTVTDERKGLGVSFTRKYHSIHEQLVTHQGAPPLDSLNAVNGRTFTIRPDHAYWQTAEALQADGYQLTLKPASSDLMTSDLLAQVAAGELDATIADSHLVAVEHTYSPELSPGLLLEPERPLGWVVRQDNPQLLAELNTFIGKQYRGRLFNVTYNKYFRNEKRIDRYQAQRLQNGEPLSPFDNQVKPLAAQFDFDWRLLVSQMYQESKFNPRAHSFAGAIGLFQVMPRTARELGYSLPLTPETGIAAGVRYLDWTRERFEVTLPLEERLWFALAAYNAGFGHVNDARRLARQMGWDGDVWFGNVERAMLLLSKRQYHSKARFGYVRGSEPVDYVRAIKDRYYAYLAL